MAIFFLLLFVLLRLNPHLQFLSLLPQPFIVLLLFYDFSYLLKLPLLLKLGLTVRFLLIFFLNSRQNSLALHSDYVSSLL